MRNFYILSFLLIFFSGNLLAQTKAAPTTQTSSVQISDLSQTSFVLSWTRGDGDSCIVTVREGSIGIPTLTDGTTYDADAVFGLGDECGTDWFCVYNGTGTTVTVTGLDANTHYLIYAFEYNGASGSEEYLATMAGNLAYTYTLPSLFSVSGGGSYCAGTSPTGVDVTLSGSEIDVDYQLKKDGNNEGSVVAGTGNVLVWEDLDAGTYTVIAINDDGTETMTGSAVVTENALPTVSFTGLDLGYCLDADTAELVPSVAGGTFSGTGITGEYFIPADAGDGTFTITYTYTDGNGCTNNATQNVEVFALTAVSFTGLNAGYCLDADTAELVPTVAGGTFSGTGITGEYFVPENAGDGTFTITYTYTDGNGCINIAEQDVDVFALPVITLDTLYNVCDTAFTLDAGNGFADYLWSTGDTTQTIIADANGTFMVTVTDVNGCMNHAETEIEFGSAISLVAADTVHSCMGADVALTVSGTAGTIVWNGTDTTSSITVSPVSGEYFYVELIVGQCTANDSIYVMPHAYPTATLPATVSECGSTILDPGSSNVSYIWTGGATTSTLNVTASGTYNVTVSNSWGCTATASSAVTILAAPNVNLGADITVALNQTVVIGVTPGYTSYLWSTGATTNTITVTGSDLGVGQHVIWASASMTNGCSATDTLIVNVTWASEINELSFDGNFAVYPNPASDKVFVISENGTAADEILVVNILGEILSTELRTISIDVSSLPSGIYSLLIKSGNSMPVKKTIVIKK
jgi:hypothetical protein